MSPPRPEPPSETPSEASPFGESPVGESPFEESQGAPSPTYASYLRLDRILDAQAPLSDTHDELLFIVIHQTSELWIKLCLHELEGARDHIRHDRVDPALKMMARVSRVQDLLIQAWGVLATMTPADYSKMRGALGTSSGFQSFQYRRMEFIMGAKNARMVAVQEAPEQRAALERELHTRSLYDEAVALLARRGFDIPRDVLDRDFSQAYEASDAVAAAWAGVYSDTSHWWDLYDLAEKLVDLEYRFQLWRYGHLKAVERVIGFKRGTGGSTGVSYLAHVPDGAFFPELLDVRRVL